MTSVIKEHSYKTCPEDGCNYESSKQGIKIHYGHQHGGEITGVLVECNYCGTEVRKDEYRLDRSKELFCSVECRRNWMSEEKVGEEAGGWRGGTITVQCENCGSDVERKPYHVERFDNYACSNECRWEWMEDYMAGENSAWYGIVGEDHPLWESGSGDVYKSGEWTVARRKVLNRDNYQCISCNTKDNLHVHHIKPLSKGGDKFDSDNLMTLCQTCHYEAHSNENDSDYIQL